MNSTGRKRITFWKESCEQCRTEDFLSYGALLHPLFLNHKILEPTLFDGTIVKQAPLPV